MNTTQTQAPNYRIYDLTGSGVTEDIYADSIDEAVEEGREWIEEGDWGIGHEPYRERQEFATLVLECEVAPIIRDENGDIDEDETRLARESAVDCSGEYKPDIPACEPADDGEHDWRDPFSLVGGIKENPGVWSHGGTRMSFRSVCARCGRYQTRIDPGSQRNPDEALEVIVIENADEASVEWVLRESCEEIKSALEAAGLEPGDLDIDTMRYSVPHEDEDSAEEYLDAINNALPDSIEAEWTGDHTTNALRDDTADIRFTLNLDV